MTTTVRVEAHVASTKEVRVKITNNAGTVEEFVLQDGEGVEMHVYDDREISVMEKIKSVGFLYTTRQYPCGCKAEGMGDVPAYCPSHGEVSQPQVKHKEPTL